MESTSAVLVSISHSFQLYKKLNNNKIRKGKYGIKKIFFECTEQYLGTFAGKRQFYNVWLPVPFNGFRFELNVEK